MRRVLGLLMQAGECGAQFVNRVFEALPVGFADHEKFGYTPKSKHTPSGLSLKKASRAIQPGMALPASTPSTKRRAVIPQGAAFMVRD